MANTSTKNNGTDRRMLLLTTLLTVIGLVMMFSAGYSHGLYLHGSGFFYIKKQAIFAAFGFIAMLVISYIPYKIYHRFAWLLFLGSYGLLAMTLTMQPINNAKRWIIFGGFSFQPSEMVKFTIVLLFAHLISMQPEKMEQFGLGFFRFFMILGAVAAVMMMQPHLSGTLLIMAIGCIVLFVGGCKIRFFLLGGIIATPVLAAVVFTVPRFRYAVERILTNVGAGDISDEAYQVNQGLIAIGSGGLFGLGLGNSRQKQLYVPEPQNDFIFSIVCEELGFIGAFLILILFLVFIIRGIKIARNAKDKFGALIVTGIIAQIGVQTSLNIAVVTSLVPNTGIGLPFFSQGGTSLFLLLCEIGVLLSVARYSTKEDEESKEPEDIFAEYELDE